MNARIEASAVAATNRGDELEHARGVSREKKIDEAVEAVGTFRPVVLEPVDKHMLQAVIQSWIAEVSLAGLPERIDDL